jgi:hypothetical protein
VHTTWIDNSDGNWEIYYKRSTDRGVHWDSTIRLTNNPAVSSYPHIAATDSAVHVIWTDDRDQQGNSNREIYYKRNPTGNVGTAEKPKARLIKSADGLSISPSVVSKTAWLTYTLPRTGLVSIALYDITGERLLLLKQAVEAAGEHRMAFKVKGLPIGVYLARMTFDGVAVTTKIIVVK